MGLSIGFFAMFALFGSIDYATVFSMSSYMNETAITIIGLLLLSGAMAKSSQIPLHSWLPGSMEGQKHKVLILFVIYTILFGLCVIIITYINSIICNTHILIKDNSLELLNLTIPPLLMNLPKETLHIITGNMLGDGSIIANKRTKGNVVAGNAKYGITLDAYSLNYLNYLLDKVYGQFCSKTENFKDNIYSYPNIKLPEH